MTTTETAPVASTGLGFAVAAGVMPGFVVVVVAGGSLRTVRDVVRTGPCWPYYTLDDGRVVSWQECGLPPGHPCGECGREIGWARPDQVCLGCSTVRPR